MNTHLGNLRKLDKEQEEYNVKLKNNDFLNPSHEKKAKEHIESLKAKADVAKKFFKKVQEKEHDGIAEGIIAGVASKRMTEYEEEKKSTQANKIKITNPNTKKKGNKKANRRVDKFVSYSNKERKLIDRIYAVISNTVDQKTAETIYDAIEEDLL